MRNQSKVIALGGVFAALAVAIMGMGTLIPVATFVCPMFCMLILQTVLKLCGSRVAWAWYGAVAILSMLLAPDKEAAAVFGFLGYYPILKPRLDRLKLSWLWKLLLFNTAVLTMYLLLIALLGMGEIAAEYAELGFAMTALLLAMGNVTFILLDQLLGKKWRKRRG